MIGYHWMRTKIEPNSEQFIFSWISEYLVQVGTASKQTPTTTRSTCTVVDSKDLPPSVAADAD